MSTSDDMSSVRVSIEGERRPSTAIIEAVAAVTDVELTTGPQLYERVNPDALDEMFAGRDGGKVTFEYADCQVTVVNDTAVIVDPI